MTSLSVQISDYFWTKCCLNLHFSYEVLNGTPQKIIKDTEIYPLIRSSRLRLNGMQIFEVVV